MARFSRKHRYNMRRADRILTEHFDGKVSLRCITRGDQVDAFVHDAARITAAGYQGTIGAGLGRPAVQRQILSAAARDGCLRCYLLECAGTAVAYQAGVICDNVYHLQSTAFLPDYGPLSAGQVLLVRVIRDLSEVGVRAIDYGFGDARYKQIYGTESWDEASINHATPPRGPPERGAGVPARPPRDQRGIDRRRGRGATARHPPRPVTSRFAPETGGLLRLRVAVGVVYISCPKRATVGRGLGAPMGRLWGADGTL